MTAFTALAFFIRIPDPRRQFRDRQIGISAVEGQEEESVLQSALAGLKYLKRNRGILDPMLLSRSGGSQTSLALVNTCTGLANVIGSAVVTFLPPPKNRVKVICRSLLFSMSTENFLLALGQSTPVWCLGAILGWLFIPVMNTNMDALFRSRIPGEMQGRVYSARNTLQFLRFLWDICLADFWWTVCLNHLCRHRQRTAFLLLSSDQARVPARHFCSL